MGLRKRTQTRQEKKCCMNVLVHACVYCVLDLAPTGFAPKLRGYVRCVSSSIKGYRPHRSNRSARLFIREGGEDANFFRQRRSIPTGGNNQGGSHHEKRGKHYGIWTHTRYFGRRDCMHPHLLDVNDVRCGLLFGSLPLDDEVGGSSEGRRRRNGVEDGGGRGKVTLAL